MIRLFVITLGVGIASMLIGCGESQPINRYFGQRIVRPDSLDLKSMGAKYCDAQFPQDSFRYEVVTWINGNCPPCCIEMGKWQIFHQEVAIPFKVRLTFYVYSSTDFKLFEQIQNTVTYSSFPAFYDPYGKFMELNGFNYSDGQTCYLVRNDTIVDVGNPVRDEQVYNRFLNRLDNEAIP